MLRTLAFFLLFAAPLRAEAPRVVTDIAPVHSLVSAVMEGIGTPDLLLPPGTSPHHYAMRASDAAALEGADFVVWIGHGLTPWLEKPVEELARDATSIELLDLAPVQIAHSDEGHDHGHGHDDDRGHDDVDPHAWLDPANAAAWVVRIADALASHDPENAAVYTANAAATVVALTALQDEISAQLKPFQKLSYAVDHDAYGYFEARFGLAHRFAITDSHADEPGPARIAQLRESVRIEAIQCVLTEGKENVGLLETVFEWHQAKVVKIDPVGADLSPGPLLYMDLMHRLSSALASC